MQLSSEISYHTPPKFTVSGMIWDLMKDYLFALVLLVIIATNYRLSQNTNRKGRDVARLDFEVISNQLGQFFPYW